MRTRSISANEVKRRWYVLDAQDVVLGRAATRIASVLRGKHRVEYTPHADTGDFVVVVNADRVRLTGNKDQKKIYHHHTGWVGNLVSRTAQTVRERKPERLIEDAVQGMLPKNTLGRQMLRKLKVYAGSEHPHSAQQPEPLTLR
jgi:large subunit ribosomal protein L13